MCSEEYFPSQKTTEVRIEVPGRTLVSMIFASRYYYYLGELTGAYQHAGIIDSTVYAMENFPETALWRRRSTTETCNSSRRGL